MSACIPIAKRMLHKKLTTSGANIMDQIGLQRHDKNDTEISDMYLSGAASNPIPLIICSPAVLCPLPKIHPTINQTYH